MVTRSKGWRFERDNEKNINKVKKHYGGSLVLEPFGTLW